MSSSNPDKFKLDYLAELMNEARRNSVTSSSYSAQRNSFIIGSGKLDGSPLSRSSIVDLANHSDFDVADPVSASADVLSSARLYDYTIDCVANFVKSPGSIEISPDLIRSFHREGFAKQFPSAGDFRTSNISLSGSYHRPPIPEEISQKVSDLCDYLNSEWHRRSPFHLSAYALWRILWIHPFFDGNGRVARAFAYFILSVKVGSILPGTPSLPELIHNHRREYYSSLESADRAAMSGFNDVSDLENLLMKLLSLQLSNTASFESSIADNIADVIDNRVLSLTPEDRSRYFSSQTVAWKVWSLGSYLLLHICSDAHLAEVHRRQLDRGHPYPGLFASLPTEAFSQLIPSKPSLHVITNISANYEEFCFYLEPDGGVALISLSIPGKTSRYLIEGALYTVRLGPRLTVENCYERFDLLIARHLRTAG